MASFYSLLGFLAVSSFEESEPGTFDMLSRLPVEMALTILRLLPGEDLLRAVLVSRKWLRLCRSDPVLRKRARRCLRQRRRAVLAARMGVRQGHGRRPREDLAVRVVTNTQRPDLSRCTHNFGLQPDRAAVLEGLPYHGDILQNTKKRRNVKTVDLPVKKMRL